MENITLDLPAVTFDVESRGVVVPVELAKIPHDVLRQVVLHGIKQKVADSASNAAMTCYTAAKGKDAPKPSRDQLAAFCESNAAMLEQETRASMEKAREALYEGRWAIRVASGTSSKWTDEQALALDMAREALLGRFKAVAAKAGVKATIENMCGLSPKIAAFFTDAAKRKVWNDQAVMAFISAQAQTDGGVDYMAQARKEIAARASMNAAVDFGDLLGDL